MLPALYGGILFLFLALCIFAQVIMALTSKYFEEEEVLKNIKCGVITWGFGLLCLMSYCIGNVLS